MKFLLCALMGFHKQTFTVKQCLNAVKYSIIRSVGDYMAALALKIEFGIADGLFCLVQDTLEFLVHIAIPSFLT